MDPAVMAPNAGIPVGGETPQDAMAPFAKPRNEAKVDYRVLNLENGIEALLVSDPETDKAAASVDVRVGFLSDPEEIPGLARE